MQPAVAHLDPFAGPPRLHGANRVGIRPGTELIHPLAATGERPLRWEVTGLPPGIEVDGDGILRGTAPAVAGSHEVQVSVANRLGADHRTVAIEVGDLLALTPPMGWNSWNVYGRDVSAEVVLEVAEAMVSTGMRDLGYSYVNIDDHWHAAAREPDGTPAANPRTFPDGIGPVAERVHELGLKLGIYSDAAHLTCGNCFGGYGYETIDAQAYASWGVDLLKYDWCYAPARRADAVERYGTMSRSLRATDRSIVLSVCEWGIRRPWRWAPQLGASCWRTTTDIFDTFGWSPLGVRNIARHNLTLHEHSGPGRWNDPDMLLVGNRGRGSSTGVVRTPNQWGRFGGRKVWSFRGLTDVQVHSHVTLWAMMAAPLLASHRIGHEEPFDRALLTNPEVLAVDQDPLGSGGRRIRSPFGTWFVVKPLADGGLALSATNLGRRARRVEVPLADAGAAGLLEVLDAWTHEELGVLDRRARLEAHLPGHGSAMWVARPAAG